MHDDMMIMTRCDIEREAKISRKKREAEEKKCEAVEKEHAADLKAYEVLQ